MSLSAQTPESTPRKETRGRVLVADDARIVRSIVHTWLGGMGFEVEEASCGLTALAATQKNKYDLVFLDINMPGLSGLTVLDSIRHNKSCHDTPVILLTTLGHAEDFDRGISLGASAYLTKPLSMQQLIRSVREVLAA